MEEKKEKLPELKSERPGRVVAQQTKASGYGASHRVSPLRDWN